MAIEHISPQKSWEGKPELSVLVPLLWENGHLSVALGGKRKRMLLTGSRWQICYSAKNDHPN